MKVVYNNERKVGIGNDVLVSAVASIFFSYSLAHVLFPSKSSRSISPAFLFFVPRSRQSSIPHFLLLSFSIVYTPWSPVQTIFLFYLCIYKGDVNRTLRTLAARVDTLARAIVRQFGACVHPREQFRLFASLRAETWSSNLTLWELMTARDPAILLAAAATDLKTLVAI